MRAIKYAGEEAILGSFQDITERKQLEARFAEILNIAPDAIIATDESGNILTFNKGALDTFGYREDEVLGQSIDMLIPERFRDRHSQNMTKFGASGEESRKMSERDGIIGLRKDDSEFPAEVTVSSLDLGEERLFNVILRDVTERKQLEEQIRRSQKMDAIGQLASGIAHDFNNILGIIMGFTEIVQRRINEDPELNQYLELVANATMRGAELTKKLLSSTANRPSETEPTAVNEFIAQLTDLIAKSVTPAISVEDRHAVDLWPVEVDQGDLGDALINLSLNARDAMPEGGTLALESANKVLDDKHVDGNPSATAGEFVMISVSDTGSGMTEEVKDKLFEPFFTTKGVGKGSGLGLSMVYGFVERSGGHIEVYSELGAGTTFRIYLPRAYVMAPDAEAGSDQQINPPRGNETILIVDDEEDLLNVAVLHLESLGYKTLTANNGCQALDILRDREDIDLLFCDVIMPSELDGRRTALMARERRPTLKVLLISGFAGQYQDDAHGEGQDPSRLAGGHLSKPYNHEELAFAVRRALDDDQN